MMGRGPSDEERREEIESHLAMRAEREEAPGAARRRFGNALQIQEAMRRVWTPPLWDEFMQDARFTWRTATRTPAFSLAALATLALGIGTATALFSVCDRLLFRSLPYRDADRLVSVGLMAPLDTNEFLLGGDYATLWRQTPGPFEAVTTVRAGTADCDVTESRPERLTCSYIQPNLLATLGLQVVAGRDLRPQESGGRVALLSHALWRRRFGGDPNIAGKLLFLDGKPVEIAGVLPSDFELPTLARADVLLAQEVQPMTFLRGFARLKPGITAQQASTALQPLFEQMRNNVPPAFRKEVSLRVRSMADRQLGDARRAAWFLLAAAGALLLIACTNVANLLLARTAARQRELSIRAALGAGRGRLARLAFTETTLLALVAAVLGLPLAAVLLRIFLTIAPEGIPKLAQASLDTRATLAAVGVAVLAAMITGIGPALATPRTEALHGTRTGVSIRPAARFTFVVVQLALTCALLGIASLLLRSLERLESIPLGFETSQVLAASVTLNSTRYNTPQKQIAFFERLLDHVKTAPGTIGAAVTDSLPPAGQSRSMIFAMIEVEGRPRPRQGTGGMVAWRLVTPDFFRVLRIPILSGRGFQDADRRGEPAMIINESLERRLFANESAVGKRVRAGGGEQPWHLIVGVAKDARNAGLSVPPEPEYYVLRGTSPRDATRSSFLVLRGQTEASAGFLREAIQSLDPELPVRIEGLEQRVARLAARPRFTAWLLSAFAVLALLVAATGVAGVAGYLVTQRTRDIGIRMALGASPGTVCRDVFGEAARWMTWGAVLGLFVGIGASRVVAGMLYGVAPSDPWAWGVTLFAMAAAVFMAVLRPAVRASRVDPQTALRSE